MRAKLFLLTGLLASAGLGSVMAGSGSNVKMGGMTSTGGIWGMRDLTNFANYDYLQSQGVGLYIHELSWTRSPADVEAKIPLLHTSAPVWESSMPSTHCVDSLNAFVMPHWPQGAWTLTVNFAEDSTSDFLALRTNTWGKATRIAPILLKVNSDGTAATTYPWSSSRWNQLRANCNQGRAWCTDTPPTYYRSRETAYRVWVAASIAWANAQPDVVSMTILHPRNATNYLDDTIWVINDLVARGARSQMWLCTSYYSANTDGTLPPDAVNHPLGNEGTDNHNYILRTAHYVVDHY